MKLFRWLLILLLALVLIIFAVSNREDITLHLWPLPLSLAAPLYLVTLLALLVGFLAGELAAWINGHHWRREAKLRQRRIETLERELAAKETPLAPAQIALPPR